MSSRLLLRFHDLATCRHTSFALDTQVKELHDLASCLYAICLRARVAKLGGPASCHRTLLLPTQGLRSLMVRRHAITHRYGIMPSHALQLPTHRSRSLAIRHHAITRLDSGAKVARLNGPASCLRVSPSLPLKTTLGRSSPHAPAPSSFRLLSIKSKSLAVWHPCQPTYFVHTSSTHRSSL